MTKDGFFTFDLNEMMRDFANFDPLEYRYQIRNAIIEQRCQGQFSSPQEEQALRNKLEDYRSTYAPLGRMDFDHSGMLENLRLIYSDKEPIEKYVELYAVIQQKVIREYLEIDGLSNLFNPKYFDFEWEMHMQLDYDKHSPSFYRDHFIHQAKNAYEIMRLLIEMPKLLDKMIVEIECGESTVSSYICQFAAKECVAIKGNAIAKDIIKQLYGDVDNPNVDKARDAKKNINKHIFKNIIKSSLIISALIHDIGYPIGHTLKGQEHLSQFVPTSHFFLGTASNFVDIAGRLSDSMLFQVVGHINIKAAFEKQMHGTLSAIAFLMYFYENGSIHKLRPAKRAAVELAALIMADHTNEYKLLDDKTEMPYYRAVYSRNPMSFLLRFCDDIQEWGRVYFYVSSNDALRVCRHCGLPIVHCNFNLDDDGSVLHPHTVRRHLCGCHEIGETEEKASEEIKQTLLYNGGDDAYISISDVQYRKLNHVEYAERVRFYNLENAHTNPEYYDFLPTFENISYTDNEPKNGTGAYLLHIDYNLYKLLQGAIIEPGFAHFRSKELEKLKRLMLNNSGFPTVIIHSDITTNPISLKVKILERFLSNMYSRRAVARRVVKIIKNLTDLTNSEIDNACTSIEIKSTQSEQIVEIILKLKGLTGTDDSESLELSALQVYMLLFSEIKFSVSEIVALMNRVEKSVEAEIGKDDNKEVVNQQLNALRALVKDKTRYESRVGLNRMDYIDSATAVFETLKDRSSYQNDIERNFKDLISDWLPSKTVRTIDYDKVLRDTNNRFPELAKMLVAQIYPDEKNKMKSFKQEIENHLQLYFNLLVASKLLLAAKEIPDEFEQSGDPTWIAVKKAGFDVEKDYMKPLRKTILDTFKNDPLISNFSNDDSSCLTTLIEDFLLQESRHIKYYSYAKDNRILPEEYFKIFEQPGYVKEAIEQYTRSEHYKDFIFGNDSLEMYSDLFLFSRLSNAVQ